MAVLPSGHYPVLSMQNWSNQIMGNQAGYQSVQDHYNHLAQAQNMAQAGNINPFAQLGNLPGIRPGQAVTINAADVYGAVPVSFHGPNSTFKPDEVVKKKAAPKVDSLPSEKGGLTEKEVAEAFKERILHGKKKEVRRVRVGPRREKDPEAEEREKLYPPAHKWRSPLGFQSRWTFDNPLKPVHKWWIRLMFRLFSRKLSKRLDI